MHRLVSRRLLIALLVTFLLAGCGTVTLQHRLTHQKVKCGPYGIDNAGVDRCISDYERRGYERVVE